MPAPAQTPTTQRGESWHLPTHRPRLLIGRGDLPALRLRCHSEYADTFHKYVTYVRQGLSGARAAGTLYGPAFCHLVLGELTRPDEFTTYLAEQLTRPERWRLPSDDMIVAADWCWEALSDDARDAIGQHLRGLLAAVEPEQNPFDHLRMHREICGLGAAVVLHRRAELAKVHSTDQAVLVQAALDYARTTLARTLQARGVMPTGGTNGIWEEADACLLVEWLHWATGEPIWEELAGTLGRCCEHYFYAQADTGVIQHGWVHDEGTHIPPEPGVARPGAVAAVPFVLAARTGEPSAGWYACRRARAITASNPRPEDLDDFWALAIYYRPEHPTADRQACPLARNFGGGWVAMRSSWLPNTTLVLFDVGQPFWRARRHFDAGQFQILRCGRLAIDSGDDVTFQATPRYRGDQYMHDQSGDWEQYFQSTIAHNCVTVERPGHRPRRYGQPWPATGNQRLIEHDYRDFDKPIEKTDRVTGHLLAFETNAAYSYAAADLAAAYELKTLLAYTRQVLLLHPGPVVVIDRVAARRGGQRITWHCHFANPPLIDGEPPPETWRLAGKGAAGIWQTSARGRWLQVDESQGRLYLQTLLPGDATWTLIGGPAKEQRVADGPHAGLPYVGGQGDGYEHWLLAGNRPGGVNAWYRLGRPADLGPQFGAGRSWGRIDVQPAQPDQVVLFVHLLWAQGRDSARRPEVAFATDGDTGLLRMTLEGKPALFRLALDGLSPGEVIIDGKVYTLTDRVMPQTRLPSEKRP